jgi:RHS repeat-associated protein
LNNAGLLTSATNPENGTATYTYNNYDNTLRYKQDAKGQVTAYTYDWDRRVIEIQRYPNGLNNAEDLCGRVLYTWGTVAPNYGRLQNVQSNAPAPVGSCSAAGVYLAYDQYYDYDAPGGVLDYTFELAALFPDGYLSSVALTAYYTYDMAGRQATVTYPMTFTEGGNLPTLTMAYDTMGRPSSLTDSNNTHWVSNVQYDFAGRGTGLTYLTGNGSGLTSSVSETRTYNAATGQLASLNWSGAGISGGIQYEYSPTQNNGQITQATDTVSGETIAYQYDVLKRLISAASTPINGTTPTPWTQTFQYDGFGNLTAKVLNGTMNSIAVNTATNQLTNAIYDGNGNMTSGAGATITYDEANRMITAQEVSGGMAYYGYDAGNKMVYRNTSSGPQIIFYGVHGEKLGVYSIQYGPPCDGSYPYTGCLNGLTPVSTSIWFAGRMIMDSSNAVAQDRLGTNRANGARFYPFGDEITSTANDRVKFGTYTRDSYTGLDYADQRFYASTYGRFNTPDPYQASAGPSDPGSWNRYVYTRGDPINRNDVPGLFDDGEGDVGQQYGEDAGSGDGNSSGSGGDPVIASVTVTGCSNPGEVYSGGPNGSCDQPIGGPYVGALQQVGNNATGIYQMVGAVAGLSAVAGVGGGLAAGYIGSTLPYVGIAGTAAAGAATTPEGQEIVGAGSNVWRLFGGTSPGMGNYWASVDPTTVSNYANAAGLPPGNTGQFIVQGVLNDMTGVEVSEAPGIGTNLGGLRQVFVPRPACQITVICVGGLNPPLVPHR